MPAHPAARRAGALPLNANSVESGIERAQALAEGGGEPPPAQGKQIMLQLNLEACAASKWNIADADRTRAYNHDLAAV